jgi:hypothetical protein
VRRQTCLYFFIFLRPFPDLDLESRSGISVYLSRGFLRKTSWKLESWILGEITGTLIYFEEDEYIKLPPHRSCVGLMLCLTGTADVKKSFKNKPFRKIYQSTLVKLQILLVKQSRSSYFSEKVKEYLGIV